MCERVLNIFVGCLVVALLIAGLPLGTEAASPGALDPNFSTDGKVTTNVLGTDRAEGIAVQPDGKIVVVGGKETPSGVAADFAVVRYNPDGSLDTTFSTDGIVTTDFGSSDIVNGVALQPDGKIVVVGQTTVASADFAIARYNPNGSLDTTFDTDGKVTTDFNGSFDNAYSVFIQADGKIVAGGIAVFASDDCAIARYNTNGSLDTTFSGDGKANFDVFAAQNTANDIALQPDGKIVAVGFASGVSGVDYAVYRINSAGALDTSFDTDGIVTTNISGSDFALSVAIQPDGKIIAAGYSTLTAATPSMARYNSVGALDTSFDGDGRVIADINPTGGSNVEDIELYGDGKIIAAVRRTSGSLLGTTAARFNSNGGLDASFGSGGFVTVNASSLGELVTGAAISGDNLLVVSYTLDFVVAQFDLTTQPIQSNDFDGDGFSDSAVFRPSAGYFFVLRSSNSIVDFIPFGIPGDIPVDGDFDGDGKTDVGIYRPSVGQWWIQRSTAGLSVSNFGQSSDKPVVGDYDKDGKSDVAFWRPSNGHYYVLTSSSNFSNFFAYPFGLNGDLPVGATFP